MKEAMKLARQIIWRYRHETPLGNQPHMIAHEADEAIEKIDQELTKQKKRNVSKDEHDVLIKAAIRSAKVVSDGFLTPKVNMLNTLAKPVDKEQGEPVACNIQMDECSSQPEQAPRCMTCGKWTDTPCRNTTPQPKQEQRNDSEQLGEPVAVIERAGVLDVRFTDIERALKLPDGTKLYTTTPQHNPLTYEEIRKWWARDNDLEDCDMCKIDDFVKVVRAVEAAHGIKE